MPDKEARRLVAKFRECQRASNTAWSALMYPVRSVNMEGYKKLVETDAAAREECDRARVAMRAYRNARRSLRIFLRNINSPIHAVYPCADENCIRATDS